MAHVRVAVVHHLQVRRGIRRNQRAGSASVPLKGGGGILAFLFVEESHTFAQR